MSWCSWGGLARWRFMCFLTFFTPVIYNMSQEIHHEVVREYVLEGKRGINLIASVLNCKPPLFFLIAKLTRRLWSMCHTTLTPSHTTQWDPKHFTSTKQAAVLNYYWMRTDCRYFFKWQLYSSNMFNKASDRAITTPAKKKRLIFWCSF